jgi:hypothetical protein
MKVNIAFLPEASKFKKIRSTNIEIRNKHELPKYKIQNEIATSAYSLLAMKRYVVFLPEASMSIKQSRRHEVIKISANRR